MVGKGKQFFSYWMNQMASIFCLEETFSIKYDEKLWSSEWGGNFFFFFLMAQNTPEVYVLYM